jgi:hypothetical protein
MDQHSGIVVKPNDDDIPWGDIDDPDESDRDTVGREQSILIGAETMAMLIFPNDLGYQRTIL